jgi:hypothetical protein
MISHSGGTKRKKENQNKYYSFQQEFPPVKEGFTYFHPNVAGPGGGD